MSDKINKINVGGVEYTLPSGASAYVEGDALVINNSGGTGSGTGSGGGGGGSSEETLIIINITSDNSSTKTTVSDTKITYSLTESQVSQLNSLGVVEIVSIVLRIKIEEVGVFSEELYLRIPSTSTLSAITTPEISANVHIINGFIFEAASLGLVGISINPENSNITIFGTNASSLSNIVGFFDAAGEVPLSLEIKYKLY